MKHPLVLACTSYFWLTAVAMVALAALSSWAQAQNVLIPAAPADSISPPPDNTVTTELTSANRHFTILVKSSRDVAPISEHVASVVDAITLRGSRIIQVETQRIPAFLSRVANHNKVELVEDTSVLVRDPDPQPSIVDFNINAQLTHSVPTLRSLYKISGKGIKVGIWDNGQVLSSHVEFDDRVTVRNPGDSPATHATHVAGTIGASGRNKRDSQGMAPEARLYSFSLSDDMSTLLHVATQDADVSVTNHSYGGVRGWRYEPTKNSWVWYGDPSKSETEDHQFGKYSIRSVEIDELVSDYPRLNVFVAAGNARDPDRDPNRKSSWGGDHLVYISGTPSSTRRPSNAQHDGGYDTIEGMALGKNVITVGAINDIPTGLSREAPEAIRVANFSSWGPADDGRVKPDLVANGARLYSPSVETIYGAFKNDSYKHLSGSSQATPTAAGIGVLLNELSLRTRGRTLRADEMKVALVSTTISPSPGPTYQIGWGAIDALAAGRVVSGDEGTLLAGEFRDSQEHVLKVERTTGDVRVTLVWLDPPGPANNAGLNDRTSALVHDLDLVVTDSSDRIHYPWSLNPDQPAQAATRSQANHRDNVERVDVAQSDAASGIWTVEIKGPSTARGMPFALAMHGFKVLSHR